MPVIPIFVTARDEAASIGACLASLEAAIRFAARASVTFSPCVVLDDCTDATAAIARAAGVRCLHASGGKVEAQRRAVRDRPDAPFHVFCDADVVMGEDTLLALARAMQADPTLRVAFPPKRTAPPRRKTPLARALHVYNARRGFSAQRTWFSGKLFAIRGWSVPEAEEIARRASSLPPSAFHDYAAPLRVDDIYLSRAIVHAFGPEALRETREGFVEFRAPETWRGMYRYHRRMQRELARTDALFPELAATHERYGARRVELAGATARERAAYAVFAAALAACRATYRVERFAVDRCGVAPGDPWPAIRETK